MLRKLLPYMILLMLCSLIVSVFIAKTLLQVIPLELQHIAVLSGYATALMSVLLIPGIIYFSLYVTKYLVFINRITISSDVFIKASKLFILVYIACEVVRFGFFYSFVYDHIQFNIGNELFLDSYQIGNWEFIQYVVNLIFIICATLLFVVEIDDGMDKVIPRNQLIKAVVPLLLIQLILNYKAIISISQHLL